MTAGFYGRLLRETVLGLARRAEVVSLRAEMKEAVMTVPMLTGGALIRPDELFTAAEEVALARCWLALRGRPERRTCSTCASARRGAQNIRCGSSVRVARTSRPLAGPSTRQPGEEAWQCGDAEPCPFHNNDWARRDSNPRHLPCKSSRSGCPHTVADGNPWSRPRGDAGEHQRSGADAGNTRERTASWAPTVGRGHRARRP